MLRKKVRARSAYVVLAVYAALVVALITFAGKSVGGEETQGCGVWAALCSCSGF